MDIEDIVYFIFILSLMVVGTLYSGYVLMTIWAWFIVPLSTAIPKISLFHAVGIAMVARYFTMQVSDINIMLSHADEDRAVKSAKSIITSIILPTFALGLGWLWSVLM